MRQFLIATLMSTMLTDLQLSNIMMPKEYATQLNSSKPKYQLIKVGYINPFTPLGPIKGRTKAYLA